MTVTIKSSKKIFMSDAKRVDVEIEDYFPAKGWVRRSIPQTSEHAAQIYTNKMKRRNDVRFLRIVIHEDGHIYRRTIKRRFPAIRPDLLAVSSAHGR